MITLDAGDTNRTLVQNIGRAIVTKITIRFSGNEVLSIHDSDVYHRYRDLWKTASERKNDQYQGIYTSNNRNTTRVRINAGNKDETVLADKAVAKVFGNRFYIPLNIELLESHMPFYQSALGNRLEYELVFNNNSRVIQATDTASFVIKNICLEYDMVTQPELARMIDNQYKGRLAILFERVLLEGPFIRDKSDTLRNFNLSGSVRSIKGILML